MWSFGWVRWYVVMVALASGHCVGQPVPGDDGGLEMSLVQVQDRFSATHFEVRLHNIGQNVKTLWLGTTLSDRPYADAVTLILTDGAGKTVMLHLRGPGYIEGQAGPLLIPLRPGASYQFRAELADYWAYKEHVLEIKLVPGRYSLKAAFRGSGVEHLVNLDMGLKEGDYWHGELQSGVVGFEVPARAR